MLVLSLCFANNDRFTRFFKSVASLAPFCIPQEERFTVDLKCNVALEIPLSESMMMKISMTQHFLTTNIPGLQNSLHAAREISQK